MIYSKEFVAKVKQEFPERIELHEMLDSGAPSVGLYLDRSRGLRLTPAKIVELINIGRINEIKYEAESAIIRDRLYSEWFQLYKKQYS